MLHKNETYDELSDLYIFLSARDTDKVLYYLENAVDPRLTEAQVHYKFRFGVTFFLHDNCLVLMMSDSHVGF